MGITGECRLLSDDKLKRALYIDDDGNDVGVDEVSYIEEPSDERTQTLAHTLTCPWHATAYRISAASLLGGWGDASALVYASVALSEYMPEAGLVSENRLGKYDDYPDLLAEIVVVHAEAAGVGELHLCLFDWILSTYHLLPMYSRFPYGLARLDVPQLRESLREAICSTLDQSDPVRAGWLLKAASRTDATLFFEFEPKIRSACISRDIVFSILDAAIVVGKDALSEIEARYQRLEDVTVRNAVTDWKKTEATFGRVL